PTKLSSWAPGIRYSSNSDVSALKPDVLTFAMLLATTSSCRSRIVCRESPMRSAFSIDGSPLNHPQAEALPGLFADLANRQRSPKPRFADHHSETRASFEKIDFIMT